MTAIDEARAIVAKHWSEWGWDDGWRARELLAALVTDMTDRNERWTQTCEADEALARDLIAQKLCPAPGWATADETLRAEMRFRAMAWLRASATRTQLQHLVATRALAEARAVTLFDAIAHGDEEHQAWLAVAIDAHFNGGRVPQMVEGSEKARLRERCMLAEARAAEWEQLAQNRSMELANMLKRRADAEQRLLAAANRVLERRDGR